MRNIILIIVIIGAIGALILTVNRRNVKPASTEDTSTNSSVADIISIENNRFIPTSVRIKVGDSITFSNNDNSAHQIESDPHPIHTDYLPLNIGLLEMGDKSTVKFTSTGTFGFHDHLNPSINGKVVVE